MKKSNITTQLKRNLAAVVSVLIALTPLTTTYAADHPYIDKFAANDIVFYNPEECETSNVGASSTILNGSDVPEKVWNFFIQQGYNDIQVAGLMGNAYVESTFVPTVAGHENINSGYWGLFQSNDTYFSDLKQTIRDAGLGQYLTQEYAGYDGYDKITNQADRDALLSLQLDWYMQNDNQANAYHWREKLKELQQKPGQSTQDAVEEAAELFMVRYERAVGGDTPLKHYTDYAGANDKNELWQGLSKRREKAWEFYQTFSGNSSGTSLTGGSSVKAIDGSNVTWIGDSISVRADSNIDKALSKVDKHTQVSKHFAMDANASSGGDSGLTILTQLANEGKIRDILVFALGTNDPNAITEDNIQTVLNTASSAKTIIFTTNYTTTYNYDQNNAKLKQAAQNDNRALIADWATVIKDKTNLLEDGIHPNAEGAQLFVDTILKSINGTTAQNGDIPDQCCDTSSISANTDFYANKKFKLTEAQTKSIANAIISLGNNTSSAAEFQASQIANAFDNSGKIAGEDSAGLIDYIKSIADYNESDDPGQGIIEVVNKVFVEGKRNLPQEVDIFIRGDATHTATKDDGSEISDPSDYKRGSTIINTSNQSFVFYTFANKSSATGNIFGYPKGSTPKANATAGASVDACCATNGSVTTYDFEGHTYAFPLAGATQENYLNPSKHNSVLSRIPCGSDGKGACHHDYYAVDMGLKMEMVDGKVRKAEDYPDNSGFSDMYYYSTGATVVAPVDGTIERANPTYTGASSGYEDKCGSITLQGDDGHRYWLGHMDNSFKVSTGDKVTAGQELGTVGVPQCAQSTQSHLHIEETNLKDSEPYIVKLMDYLWDHLDSSDSGSPITSCDTMGLKPGGLSDEEAQAFVDEYHQLAVQVYKNGQTSIDINGRKFTGYTECPGGLLANCVAMSRYFIHKYLDGPESLYNASADGGQLVDALGAAGLPTGTEPRPYAIFSIKKPNAPGHTGVVMSVREDGSFTAAEAGCSPLSSSGFEFGALRKDRTIHDGQSWSFAYTDQYIRGF